MIKFLIFTVQTNLLSLYSAWCYYTQFVCHSMMTGLIKSSCNNHAVKLQLVPHMNFMAVWFCSVQFCRMSAYGYLQFGNLEHQKPLHLHRTGQWSEHRINNGGILPSKFTCSREEISHILSVLFPLQKCFFLTSEFLLKLFYITWWEQTECTVPWSTSN